MDREKVTGRKRKLEIEGENCGKRDKFVEINKLIKIYKAIKRDRKL
jgi:hypothetical protein